MEGMYQEADVGWDPERGAVVRTLRMTTPGWLMQVPASIATELILEGTEAAAVQNLPVFGPALEAAANYTQHRAQQEGAWITTRGANWMLGLQGRSLANRCRV